LEGRCAGLAHFGIVPAGRIVGAAGVAESRGRPSYSDPGLSSISPGSAIEKSFPNRFELLAEIAPGLKRAAIMFNPDLPGASAYMPSLEMAARSLKVEPIIAPIHSDAEIEAAIIALGREPGSGLVVVPDGSIAAHRAPIISAAARNNVPKKRNLLPV
jgi:putative ABC transport system substrate-binding protein